MAKASVPQVEVSLTSHGEPNDSFAPSQVPGPLNNAEIHSDPQGAKMVRHDWSDDDLARRLSEHDPEALETLISRYSREIFYFIRLVLDGVGVTQDAEECVNDLFVAVWQEIETFDPGRGTLRTWLTMRAKYIALDRRRQLCRRQAHSLQTRSEEHTSEL